MEARQCAGIPPMLRRPPKDFKIFLKVGPTLSKYGQSEFPVNLKSYGNRMWISHVLIHPLYPKFT